MTSIVCTKINFKSQRQPKDGLKMQCQEVFLKAVHYRNALSQLVATARQHLELNTTNSQEPINPKDIYAPMRTSI